MSNANGGFVSVLLTHLLSTVCHNMLRILRSEYYISTMSTMTLQQILPLALGAICCVILYFSVFLDEMMAENSNELLTATSCLIISKTSHQNVAIMLMMLYNFINA